MSYFEYDDDDDFQRLVAGRVLSTKPYWFERGLSRCECAGEPKLVASADGYSDSSYKRWRCEVCGNEFCNFLEG